MIGAPIARSASMIPARVGLIPTAGSVRSELGVIAAATIQKAAALISPGTSTSRGRSGAPGRTRIVAPRVSIAAPIAPSIRSV